MRLIDGERATMGIPGLRGTQVTFANYAGRLTVSALPVPILEAMLAR